MGNPMSTLLKYLLLCVDVMSVSFFNSSFKFFSPFSVSGLHFSVKSTTSVSAEMCSTIIRTLSELRILQIVAVDSWFLALNIFFPKILLIRVVLPELVSP